MNPDAAPARSFFAVHKLWLIPVALVLLLMGAVAGIGVYLDSDMFRHQVEKSLSNAVGTTVTIDTIHLDWNGRMSIDGFALPQKEGVEGENFVFLKNLDVEARLLPLLKKRIEIVSIRLDKLDIVIHQSETGELLLPFDIEKTVNTDEEHEDAVVDKRLKDFQVSVESLDIKPLNLSIVDHRGKLLLYAQNLRTEGALQLNAGVASADNEVMIDLLQVAPGIKVRNVRIKIPIRESKVHLDPLAADLGGGKVTGNVEAEPLHQGRVFEVNIHVEGADVDRIMQDIGAAPGTLKGLLTLDFKGQGTLSSPLDFQGSGTFTINGVEVGSLKQSNPEGVAMGFTGFLSGIKPLQDGKFDFITCVYSIRDKQVVVENLNVESNSLKVGLSGGLNFDGQLDMKGRVLLNPSLPVVPVNIFVKFYRWAFSKKSPEEEKWEKLHGGVPFRVTGPADNPRVKPEAPDPLNVIPVLSSVFNWKSQPAPPLEEKK